MTPKEHYDAEKRRKEFERESPAMMMALMERFVVAVEAIAKAMNKEPT